MSFRSFSILRALLIGGMLGICLGCAQAIDLSVAGSWTPLINADTLISGAGSNLTSTVTSTADLLSLSIANTSGDSDNWRIDVRRVDLNWDPRLHLSLRRSSTGIGPGTVADGESFLELTNLDATLFSGAGDRAGIGLQVKVEGLSVQLPPDSYSTTITYTVVDVL